ncbi:unnamed protein product [Closterium sp. Yama58-4]|nr:unnamed protein product [Closterium sp. Yama58-4]
MSKCLKQHEEAVQEFQQKAASMQISFSEMELSNVRLKHNLSSQEAALERLNAEHENLVSSLMQDLKCHEEAKLRSEEELADLQTKFSELELCNAVLEQKLASKDTELETAKAEHRIAFTSILQDLKFHQDTKLEMDEKAASMKRKISELELQTSTLKKETGTLSKQTAALDRLKSELDECRAHQKEMELVNKRLLHHENTFIQMRSLAKRLRNEKNDLLEKVELLKSANEEQEDSNSSQVQALAQKLRMAKSELAVWKERCLSQSLKYTSTEDIECSASAVTGRLKKHRSFSKPASPSLSYSAASVSAMASQAANNGIPSRPRCEQSEGTAATFSTTNYSQSQGASRLSKRSRKDPP